MEKGYYLNISETNVEKLIKVYNKINKQDDIYLCINNPLYFIDTLTAFLKIQSDLNILNKIIIVPQISSNDKGFIIDDNIINELDLDIDNRILDSYELFKTYKNSFFYLKTSGSTGEPSLIKKYIYEMINEAICLKAFISKYVDIDNEICSLVPHNHMYGLTFSIFLPIICDYKVIKKEPIIENISTLSHEILITSPEFLKNIIYINDKLLNNFKNIKLIVSAGSKLDNNLREHIKNINNGTLLNIYGSTETGVIAGDIGYGFYIFPSVSLKNQNEKIIIKSDWTCDRELNDYVKIENDKLEIYGRTDRIVKVADKRISLDIIETNIKSIDIINDAYAYVKNNRIGILIELTQKGKELFRNNGKKSIVTEIKYVMQKDFNNTIRYYKIVNKIFRNENGKIIKKENDELINHKSVITFNFEKEKITNQGKEVIYSAYINEDIFYFPFHFYTFPLVPGFIEVDSIVKLLNNFGYDYTKIKNINNLKFTSFIKPLDTIYVILEMNNNIVKFQILSNNVKAASGVLKYAE